MRSVVYENAAKALPAALRVFVSLNCSSALNPILIGVDPLVHCFIGESSLRSQPFYHRDTLNKPCIAYVLSGYPKKRWATLSTGQGKACCCPKLKRKLIYSLFVLT